MRGFYLSNHDSGGISISGVSSGKIDAQIKAFNEAGLNCEYLQYKRSESTIGKVLLSLPFFSDGITWPYKKEVLTADYLYLRKPRFISKELISFLKECKRHNPSMRVVMEIPTYPYDKEMTSQPRMIPALLKDKYNRRKLNGVIDRIAVLGGEKEVFGIPTLPFRNGFDPDAIHARKPSYKTDEINIICVATYSFWHGIDRFVEGMSNSLDLVKKRKIKLHLIGDGPALSSLKNQVDKNCLSEFVIFYGKKNHIGIEPIYDKCTLAIECLGCHRKDLIISSSLKSREYMAKGIPFVYSGMIDIFCKAPVDFCLNVKSDEEPIDIERVVDFYDALYGSEGESDLIKRIRLYAESHISVQKTMSEVIGYLMKDRKE